MENDYYIDFNALSIQSSGYSVWLSINIQYCHGLKRAAHNSLFHWMGSTWDETEKNENFK